tara:strand:+ start:1710 stop:2087 length:378 start_codon:yes stop_codon:yes gene_type:complete
MSDSYVSSTYDTETDTGKTSQEVATYTNKDGNTVYTVANYKELEAEALKISEEVTKNNPLGITTAMNDLDMANRAKEISNEQHLKYLKETDWYVVRKADTGVAIPTDVANKRQASREAIQKLSTL